MITQAVNCVVQIILLIAVFFFWGVASRRYGAGVDTSIHPQGGGSNIYLDVIFALVVALLVAFSVITSPLFQ